MMTLTRLTFEMRHACHKQLATLLLILITAMLPGSADAQKPTPRDRNMWMKEMQQYKNDYICEQLKLTDEQKAKFIPLYNSMEAEVRKVADQTMKMVRDVKKKGKEATELEYEKAAEAQYELKAKEAKIELKYFKSFKTVLTPQQLIKLKKAERDYQWILMKKHDDFKILLSDKNRDLLVCAS